MLKNYIQNIKDDPTKYYVGCQPTGKEYQIWYENVVVKVNMEDIKEHGQRQLDMLNGEMP